MGKAITHKHILQKFGQKLQKTRQKQGVNQEALASKLNMHRTYIGMIERGERNPTVRTLYKISKALGVESSHLLPFNLVLGRNQSVNCSSNKHMSPVG